VKYPTAIVNRTRPSRDLPVVLVTRAYTRGFAVRANRTSGGIPEEGLSNLPGADGAYMVDLAKRELGRNGLQVTDSSMELRGASSIGSIIL